ncbi:hypothetical protein BD310DRAFT_913898 [Dichomitus squalens]|uniref:MYND-type domain-containing protein n=1 Tax=Dichomitus squalens TaxID=114155 RepID=A0A4Q9QBQ5_9APHY|nr:hypothetical protein BD310DRAFT_913898 [Dichomitus squalens]
MDTDMLTYPDDGPALTPNDSVLAEVSKLSLQARQLDARGSYTEAERLLQQALDLVDPAVPSPTLASLWNTLGELYLHMGKLDGAEHWFEKSLDVSIITHNFKEITTSRENLARVHRIRSELLKAKALKMLGAPDDMCCSNHACAKGLLRSPDLSICGGCKGAFYCSHECQREDWERHKRRCRRDLAPDAV